jgi:hypothetical protein
MFGDTKGVIIIRISKKNRQYTGQKKKYKGIDLFIVFNATFKNISAISWQLVLVVEEPESPEITTDHDEAT